MGKSSTGKTLVLFCSVVLAALLAEGATAVTKTEEEAENAYAIGIGDVLEIWPSYEEFAYRISAPRTVPMMRSAKRTLPAVVAKNRSVNDRNANM